MSSLRRQEIVSEFDMGGHVLKKQLEEASKRGYTFVTIVAPEEQSRNELIVRNMTSGSENTIKQDDFIKNPKKVLQQLS